MKNYLIISLLFLSVGVSQQKKTDKPNPMKGVKTQTKLQYLYEEKFGEYKEILNKKTVNKYDSDGNKVEWSIYFPNGSLSAKFFCKYDSDGNKVEQSYYEYNSEILNEIKVDRIDYKSDGSLSRKWIYKYDSNGNMVEESIYFKDGSLLTKWIYKNDSDGNMIENRYYEADGSELGKRFYKYDSNGNMVEEKRYDGEGSLQHQRIYKSDSNGNPIEILVNKKDGHSSETIFKNKYDNKNRIIEVIKYIKIFGGFNTPSAKTTSEYEEY